MKVKAQDFLFLKTPAMIPGRRALTALRGALSMTASSLVQALYFVLPIYAFFMLNNDDYYFTV